MRVLFFGDSIMYGAWDTQAGWVERLKREAHKQTVESQGDRKLQMINLGIGGDTSTKILARMPSEVQARYSPSWPLALVVSFGANDSRSQEGAIEVPLDQFTQNIQRIIALAKQHTNRLLFVGPAPIGEPVHVFKGQEYSDARVKEYERHMQPIAEEAGVPFVPLRPAFEAAGISSLYSYDYIHPNDAGHELIAKTVQPKLWELISMP